jgi:hypothetical protein
MRALDSNGGSQSEAIIPRLHLERSDWAASQINTASDPKADDQLLDVRPHRVAVC